MKRYLSAVSLLSATLIAACESPTTPAGVTRSMNRVKSASSTVVTNAVYTIDNSEVDGTGHCWNGPENPQNCNIYEAKQFAWLGGESVNGKSGLADGSYFFAVLAPGAQHNPNDGGPDVLSDVDPSTNTGAGDAYTDRTFTLAGGVISYAGTHEFANNRIRLFGYDDTPNAGGEYIMAVCSLANGYPVDPDDCKYDAFKIKLADEPPPPPPAEAQPLTASKTAAGAYDNTYRWGITKSVDKTIQKLMAGSIATFNYTVTATHDAGTISGVKVTGTITVSNPNTASVAISGLTDVLSDATACTVNDAPAALASGDTQLQYTCALAALPSSPLGNTATVSWSEQTLSDGSHLAAGSATATVADISFAETVIDGQASITDSFAGLLGTPTRSDASPITYTYARNIPAASNVCTTYGNTASFTTTNTSGSASQSVMVCGNVAGGLTIGFWQNKNGQAILTGAASVSNVCTVGSWLRGLAPFADLGATATCAGVATYVTNVIKAANASGASMNAMLKAQMLATSLDVYFSDAALGGNKILAPAPLAGLKVDLAMVCSAIATCPATYADVSGSWNGAGALTIGELLTYAASQSNAGGSSWYGNVKSVQEGAKNTFDAINNRVAMVAP